jgi:hypothetical protein
MVQRVLQWERKKGSLATNVTGPWKINVIFFFFFLGQTYFIVTRNEGKKKERRSNMKKIPKTVIFKHIRSAFVVWCTVISLGPRSVCT